MRYHHILSLSALLACVGHSTNASAQAAGAGADFNKKERAVLQEQRRLDRVDPPIRPDPLGNALMGGVVTGTIKGAAAGAASAARSAAVGTAVQEAKQGIQERRRGEPTELVGAVLMIRVTTQALCSIDRFNRGVNDDNRL